MSLNFLWFPAAITSCKSGVSSSMITTMLCLSMCPWLFKLATFVSMARFLLYSIDGWIAASQTFRLIVSRLLLCFFGLLLVWAHFVTWISLCLFVAELSFFMFRRKLVVIFCIFLFLVCFHFMVFCLVNYGYFVSLLFFIMIFFFEIINYKDLGWFIKNRNLVNLNFFVM